MSLRFWEYKGWINETDPLVGLSGNLDAGWVED